VKQGAEKGSSWEWRRYLACLGKKGGHDILKGTPFCLSLTGALLLLGTGRGPVYTGDQ
jgi:hypothetical protein